MIQNYSTKEIASKLNISEKTVRNHISNTMQKLGVKGRSGAVVELLRLKELSLWWINVKYFHIYFIGDIMLKQKALRKMLITSITVVILLMIYLMPTNSKTSTNILDVDKKIEYTQKDVGYIYLLNDNDLLIRVNVLLDSKDSLENRVTSIINNLLNTNVWPKNLKSLLPNKTKLVDIDIDDDYLSVSFSKNILEIDKLYQEKLIEEIAYSIFDLKEIKKISIYVEDENINKYFKDIPEVITRDFGINKKYDIKSFKNIQKVVVYYMEEIDKSKYFVPVTSYINDDIMTLNFNNSIFISDGNVLEEVVYTISNSVFDNYDIDKIIFNVENKTINEIKR